MLSPGQLHVEGSLARGRKDNLGNFLVPFLNHQGHYQMIYLYSYYGPWIEPYLNILQ